MLIPLDARRSRSARGRFDLTQWRLDEETTLVAVSGELDLATAQRLKWPLVDALDSGTRRLVIDLSRVGFMDSTALGVLIGIRRGLKPDSRMALVCTDPNVLRIFEIAGLDVAFQIFATREEALSHMSREASPRL